MIIPSTFKIKEIKKDNKRKNISRFCCFTVIIISFIYSDLKFFVVIEIVNLILFWKLNYSFFLHRLMP